MTDKQITEAMCSPVFGRSKASKERSKQFDIAWKNRTKSGIFNVLRDKPLVKSHPMNPLTGLAIFSGLAIIGVSIGASIGTYIFFGTATLVGLIALIESNKALKYVAQRSTGIIDVTIFVATVYATAQLGVTVSAALVFAGLGYTLVYSPYMRTQLVEKPS